MEIKRTAMNTQTKIAVAHINIRCYVKKERNSKKALNKPNKQV